MLMTIDVGNTNITVGIFDQQQLAATFRMTTKTPRTSDELGMQLRMMLSARQIDWTRIHDVVISSVVPKVMHALESAIIGFLRATRLSTGRE